MRHIQVEDGLRLRFPGRGEDFDEGVEIGLLIASLAGGGTEFARRISSPNIEQARDVARQFGYRARIVDVDGAFSELSFFIGRRRPALTLVRDDLRFG